MKYITLIIGLLFVGCGKQEKADTNESTPTTNTNKADGTTEKPVKELTLEEKVVGTYEVKKYGKIFRIVLLETGIVEKYIDGKKDDEGKWSISEEGKMYVIDGNGFIDVLRINKDKSITNIARIDKDGKRMDFEGLRLSSNAITLKKIK